MITIIGTGHIYNISEQIAFIIKHTWPDAVLVELDEARFKAMTDPDAKQTEAPKAYRKAAEYQNRMAAENNTTSGADLMTAIHAGNMIGADVHFIDKNAGNVMERMWDEMPFAERMRYRMSGLKDRFASRTSEEALEEFAADEEKVIEDMRRRFPTFVRIVIDERNDHMVKRITEVSKDYSNLIVVMGDGHVESVSKMLGEGVTKKIRLKDLMNKERMDIIRKELWTHEGNE